MYCFLPQVFVVRDLWWAKGQKKTFTLGVFCPNEFPKVVLGLISSMHIEEESVSLFIEYFQVESPRGLCPNFEHQLGLISS